jgi:hypothetical protein
LITAEAYPNRRFAPLPPVINNVPDFTLCTNENKLATVKIHHAIDMKTRADIITMNAALTDVFLSLLSTSVRASYQQRRLQQPNIIFVELFDWFVAQYGTTTAKDRDANQQWMAADWHPADGFDALTLRLFTGAAYGDACRYPISDRDVIDIGICVIKQCGLYSEEYKQWIARGISNVTVTLWECLTAWKAFIHMNVGM